MILGLGGDDLVMLFREDESEAGSTSPDAYMQIARDFEMYIVGLSHPDRKAKFKTYLAAGAPAFLLVVQGTKGSFPSALPIVQFKLTC